jgi:hypothetical protein
MRGNKMAKDKSSKEEKKMKDPWLEKLQRVQNAAGADIRAQKTVAEDKGKEQAQEQESKEKEEKASPGGTTREPVGDEKGPEVIRIPGLIPGRDIRSGPHTVTQVAGWTPEELERQEQGQKEMEAFLAGKEPPAPPAPASAEREQQQQQGGQSQQQYGG